jgi:hypothetical protein
MTKLLHEYICKSPLSLLGIKNGSSHLNYNHIHEKDEDHDEAGLHLVPPLFPSPVVHVPSFRLPSSLESFVAMAYGKSVHHG